MDRRTVGAGSIVVFMAVVLSGYTNGLKQKKLHITERQTDNFGFLDNPPKARIGPQGPETLTHGDIFSYTALTWSTRPART